MTSRSSSPTTDAVPAGWAALPSSRRFWPVCGSLVSQSGCSASAACRGSRSSGRPRRVACRAGRGCRGCARGRRPRNRSGTPGGEDRSSSHRRHAGLESPGRSQDPCAKERGREEEDRSRPRDAAGSAAAGRSGEPGPANARLGAEGLRGASGPGPQGHRHSTGTAEPWPASRANASGRTASRRARPGEEGSRPTASAAEEGLI